MAIYTPNKISIPTGLDELGYYYGLKRFDNETIDHYRQRLLEEAREPAGATGEQFNLSVSRQLGFLQQPVFEIDVARDLNGVPLIDNPYVRVDANSLSLYSDYETDTIEITFDFNDRTEAYFMQDLIDGINASTNYTATELITGYDRLLSKSIMYGTNERVASNIELKVSRSNKLPNTFINSFHSNAFELFRELVVDASSIANPGDFYIDKINGVVFTNDNQYGFCSYSYFQIPYTVYRVPVRAWPLNASDLDTRFKSELISDETGALEYKQLNSFGARVINEMLKVHPLGWGK